MKETKIETECSSMREMLEDCLYKLQEKTAKEGLLGISSGFQPLDDLTGGFENGKVYVIGGRPCMGKEEFMLSMIRSIVVESELPVLLFSTKKLKSEYFARLVSFHCDIPTSNLLEGCLEPHEWVKLDKGIHTLADSSLFIHDSLGITLDELIETTQNCIKEKDISIIFIDSLQMIELGNANGNPAKSTADVMYSLQQLAIQEKLSIIVGSMLSKYAENGEDYGYRRPNMSNLPDSSFIEELANVVMFVHRPEYYHVYSDEHGEDLHGMIQIIVKKNGFKPLGEFFLNYRHETGAVSMTKETSSSTCRSLKGEDIKYNKAVRDLINIFDLE